MHKLFAALLLAGCATATSETAPARQSAVTLAGPAIIRDTAEAGPETSVAGYVRLANGGDTADKLVGVSCDCAERVEMHPTIDPEMKTLGALEIPDYGKLEIRPDGPRHLMLMGVKAPIAVGETILMRLAFDRAARIEVDFIAVANSTNGWDA